jgi:hypothetical protein
VKLRRQRKPAHNARESVAMHRVGLWELRRDALYQRQQTG